MMRTLGTATLALMMHMPAWAGASEAPWSDGLATSAPRTAWAELENAWAFGTTRYAFVQARGGTPLYRAKRETWSLGLNIDTGLHDMRVPSEGRGTTGMGAIGGELWFLFYGPERRAHHAVGLRGAAVPMWSDIFFIDNRTVIGHGALFYDLLLTGDTLEGHIRIDLSLQQDFRAFVPLVGSLTWLATEPVALQLGVRTLSTNRHVSTCGIRSRPTEFLELGAGVILPIDGLGMGPEPVISVKIFDAKRPAVEL